MTSTLYSAAEGFNIPNPCVFDLRFPLVTKNDGHRFGGASRRAP